jgi:Recombinase
MSDRIRDIVSGPLTLDYFNQRTAKGWVVSAVEWRAPSTEESEAPAPETQLQEVPYGQHIAQDCGHLVDDAFEMDVLLFIYERVVSGWRPPELAAELNHHGYRTRRSSPWTASAVFDLLPRLIELSPKLQARPDWPSRRAKLTVIA